jgi:transcription initiation factor IIE alpha subunit
LLQLHTKDINKHCNLLRLHGLILGEETKEKAAAEELSAKSAVLEAAGLTAANVQTGKRSQHYRPPAVTYRYWIEPGRFVKVLKYRYLRMLATLEQRAAARDQNSYYRCSASSVEQCTDVYDYMMRLL